MNERRRQSRFDDSGDVVVMKFGGTSVEDAAAIRRVIGIVQSRLDEQAVVVVSALAGVTDQLLQAGSAATQGHLGSALEIVRQLYVRHEEVADSVAGSARGALTRELRDEFRALESLLQDLQSSNRLDLKAQDYLLGFGEVFSSRLVTEALREDGVRAAHIDARTCIVTDARHGQATPLCEVTNQRIQDTLTPLLDSSAVPVLGGFIAATGEGTPTTLGRGGSDYSATIIAAALHAVRVEIWTDVDGMMTADPRLCPEARVIRCMSFDEAAELAHFGAKVLHPAALSPAARENIPVYVLNSRRPEGEGTEIVARARTGNPVSAITARKDVALVEIEPHQFVNSELLRSVFAAFDQYSCTVDGMATSPSRLSLLVGSTPELTNIAADLAGTASVRWENHKALVCLVGENLRRQPEVVSRALAVVSDIEAQVVFTDASDRTISFLIEECSVDELVQRLHGVFFARRDASPDWGGISTAFCQAG